MNYNIVPKIPYIHPHHIAKDKGPQAHSRTFLFLSCNPTHNIANPARITLCSLFGTESFPRRCRYLVLVTLALPSYRSDSDVDLRSLRSIPHSLPPLLHVIAVLRYLRSPLSPCLVVRALCLCLSSFILVIVQLYLYYVTNRLMCIAHYATPLRMKKKKQISPFWYRPAPWEMETSTQPLFAVCVSRGRWISIQVQRTRFGYQTVYDIPQAS